jgi:hypothetical protein
VSSRVPAAVPRPARRPCGGRLVRCQVHEPSLVPARVRRPATSRYPAGWRRTRRPPASRRPGLRQVRAAAAVRTSLALARDRRPARIRCSACSGRTLPGRPPSQVPAAVLRPAMIRCSAGSGRIALAPAGGRVAPPRTGWCCRTGRRHTAPGRTARPWAPGPGRTAQDRTGPGRLALALAPDRTGPLLAARQRTGPARSRPAPAQVLLASIRAGRAATAVHDRGHPALPVAPARHRASQGLAGRDRPGRARAAPRRTGRHRPGAGQAARHQADLVPRRPPTPERGIPLAARSVPLAAATRPRARLAFPVGPATALGRPRPAPGSSVPGTRASGTRAPAAPRRGRPALARARARTRKAQAAASRRTRPGGAHAVAPSAAGPAAADQGEPAGGGSWWGVAVDGQHPASRPRGAARVIRGRTRPACPSVAGSRAWAACPAPAWCVTALGACPRGGAGHGPCLSRRPGSRDPRGKRRLPGKSPAGRRPCP